MKTLEEIRAIGHADGTAYVALYAPLAEGPVGPPDPNDNWDGWASGGMGYHNFLAQFDLTESDDPAQIDAAIAAYRQGADDGFDAARSEEAAS